MRVLVCTRSGIGNAITTMPLVQSLLELKHEVSVWLAESRGTPSLFSELPVAIYSEKVLPPQHDLALCTVVCAAWHKDACYVANKKWMTDPGRSGYDYFSIERYKKHEVELNMDFARRLGYKGDIPIPVLPVKKCKRRLYYIKKPIVVGIGHLKGDGNSELKHWGNENFAGLCDLLHLARFKPTIVGGVDDTSNAEGIAGLARFPIDIHIGQSLPKTFYLLKKIGLCITNETMLVPASHGIAKCLSLVFDEALNNPIKTYPYGGHGMALCGPKAEITPHVVMGFWENLLKGKSCPNVQRYP